MKILFLGAGATGGYFGGRMAAAGVDAAFLVRPKRAARLREGPLRIESPMGDLAVPVAAVTADAIGAHGAGAYDCVVLSCKAYDLDDAIASITPAVGAQTQILPLLNGMAHLDRLDAAFGADRVLGGLCQIAATLAADGTIRHLNQTHLLVFGARRPDQEPFCAELAREVGRAAFEMRHSDDIVLEMWEKWVMLASLAAVTCLMRATIGDIVAAPHGQAIVTENSRRMRGDRRRRRVRAARRHAGRDPQPSHRAGIDLRRVDATRCRGRQPGRGGPHPGRPDRPRRGGRRLHPAPAHRLLPPQGLRKPPGPGRGRRLRIDDSSLKPYGDNTLRRLTQGNKK